MNARFCYVLPDSVTPAPPPAPRCSFAPHKNMILLIPLARRPPIAAPGPTQISRRTVRQGWTAWRRRRMALSFAAFRAALNSPSKSFPALSRTGIVGTWGTALKVAVAAPPEGGKANAAVIKLLAAVFGVRKADVLDRSRSDAAAETHRCARHQRGPSPCEVGANLAGPTNYGGLDVPACPDSLSVCLVRAARRWTCPA